MAYQIKVTDTNLTDHYHTVYTMEDVKYSKDNDGMYRKNLKDYFFDLTPSELRDTIEEIIVGYNNLNPEDIIPRDLLEDLKLDWLSHLSPRKYINNTLLTGDRKEKLIEVLEEVGILVKAKKGIQHGTAN